MKATFYYSKLDRRYINKIDPTEKPAQQIGQADQEITPIEDFDILHPTFILSLGTDYMNFNYIYVRDLHRYYFVDSLELSKNRAYITCTIDVLQSYKDEIMNGDVILERQEKKWNSYQHDEEQPRLVYDSVDVQYFNKSTLASDTMILVTAGG